MATPIQLRCRTRSATYPITDLDSESTLLDLKALIVSLTDLDVESFVLKSGIPPTAIQAGDNCLLKDCGVNHGDFIIIEETKGSRAPAQKRSLSPHSGQVKKEALGDTSIRRKAVPANNSCLFSSIDFCINGVLKLSNATEMRRTVADIILSQPKKYTEALLGQKPEDYANWVKYPDSWGGAIELSILCHHYMTEMVVVDIQHTRTEKFGEQYDNRILLIYDGIHYDPLYEGSESKPRTIFSVNDDRVVTQALSLAEKEKANRQYTDAKNFKLKCVTCGQGLAGQKELSKHAKDTGHSNFAEF
ncbi:ubiquitin thioesterase OTU1-like [Watersipora subatra]|uniref:ubiquitin thioesterase OTU1-like n=1 Tax=Watersipora subatra TaxID=2589382 RepID=UPI00355B9D87